MGAFHSYNMPYVPHNTEKYKYMSKEDLIKKIEAKEREARNYKSNSSRDRTTENMGAFGLGFLFGGLFD